MTIQDDFKAEIEAFLARHDMKPAVFGTQALHDPKFVFDLREGRSPSVKTIEKVRAWMAEQEGKTGTAEESPASGPTEGTKPAGPASEPPAKEAPPWEADEKPAAATAEQPTPEDAGQAERAQEEPASRKPEQGADKARGKHWGIGRTLLAIIVLLIIALGALAVWKPGPAYNVARSLYQRIVTTSGDANRDVEQFSAVVEAVQNDFNSLRQQISRLQDRVNALENRSGGGSGDTSGVESARIDTLEERISALENRPTPEGGSGAGIPSPAVSARLDELERRLAEIANQPETGSSVERLDEMERRLAQQENQPAVRPQDLDMLRNRLDDLQQGVSQLQMRQEELAGFGADVAALQEQVNSVTSGVNDMSGLQAGIERNAMISAFMRLDADVRSGQPYAASLRLYQRQRQMQEDTANWPAADALDDGAESGIATRESLEQRLEDLIPQILAGQEEGDSWTERLVSRLQSIIVVRRTGEQEGNDPEALVARAETRLAAGDLAGAITEMEQLPESRRAIAEDWLADARARRETLETLAGMATAFSDTEGG